MQIGQGVLSGMARGGRGLVVRCGWGLALGAVAAAAAGCAHGGARWRQEPTGSFRFGQAEETVHEGMAVRVSGVRVRAVADEGDLLREDWTVELAVEGSSEGRGLGLDPTRMRLVVEPVEAAAPYLDTVSESEPVEPGVDIDNDPEHMEPPVESDEDEPILAMLIPGSGPDAPLTRLRGAVGAATDAVLLAASSLRDDRGGEVERVRVAGGESGRFEVVFRDVPAFTVHDAIGRGLLLPTDVTFEVETENEDLIHVPLVRPGTGVPGWYRRGFDFGLQLGVGASMSSYGERDNALGIDFEGGPQFHFGHVYLLAQVHARISTRVSPRPGQAEATDGDEAAANEDAAAAPLDGDFVSLLGGRIAVGYEALLSDDLNVRVDVGWRPSMAIRDQAGGSQGIHAITGQVEIGFREWDPTPYYRARPQSRWGIFLGFARELGALSGPSWKPGTTVSVGVSIRPRLGP